MPADINSVRSAIVAAAAELVGDSSDEADETFLRLAAALDAIDRGRHAFRSRTLASEAQERLMALVQEGR